MITYETVIDDGSIQLILWTYEEPQESPKIRPMVPLVNGINQTFTAVM